MNTEVRNYFQYENKKGILYYYDTATGKTTYKFPEGHCIRHPTSGEVLHCPAGYKPLKARPKQAGTSSLNAPGSSSAPSGAALPDQIGPSFSAPTMVQIPADSQSPLAAASDPALVSGSSLFPDALISAERAPSDPITRKELPIAVQLADDADAAKSSLPGTLSVAAVTVAPPQETPAPRQLLPPQPLAPLVAPLLRKLPEPGDADPPVVESAPTPIAPQPSKEDAAPETTLPADRVEPSQVAEPESPAAAPIVAESPAAAPIVAESPAAAPIVAESPAAAPIVAESPAAAPIVAETVKSPPAGETPATPTLPLVQRPLPPPILPILPSPLPIPLSVKPILPLLPTPITAEPGAAPGPTVQSPTAAPLIVVSSAPAQPSAQSALPNPLVVVGPSGTAQPGVQSPVPAPIVVVSSPSVQPSVQSAPPSPVLVVAPSGPAPPVLRSPVLSPIVVVSSPSAQPSVQSAPPSPVLVVGPSGTAQPGVQSPVPSPIVIVSSPSTQPSVQSAPPSPVVVVGPSGTVPPVLRSPVPSPITVDASSASHPSVPALILVGPSAPARPPPVEPPAIPSTLPVPVEPLSSPSLTADVPPPAGPFGDDPLPLAASLGRLGTSQSAVFPQQPLEGASRRGARRPLDGSVLASVIVAKQRTGTLAPQSGQAVNAGGIDISRFHSATAAGRVRNLTMKVPQAAAQDGSRSSSVPLIARTFSAQEIIHLAFGLEPTFSRQELVEHLAQYRFEDFAAGCFRRHRSGGALSKAIPTDDLTHFSAAPLKKPLLQSVRKEFKAHSAFISSHMLEYTRVRACRSELVNLRKILHILREDPQEIVDDFYFQLLRQTRGNPNEDCLWKTWELLLVMATIFPVSDERHIWILAQLALAMMDKDQRIAWVATFIYIRFRARYYIGRPLEYKSYDAKWLERIPAQMIEGKAVFGVSLYEVMWCQRAAYPKLVVPYVLHYMVTELRARGAFKTEAIFRVSGNEGLIKSIRDEVNDDVTAIGRGDVNVIAGLLKLWLKELPNPVIPIELTTEFKEMCEENKYLRFAERIPQVHQLVLIYLVGFVKELAAAARITTMEKADLAMVFGPLIVNPVKAARKNSDLVQKLTELGVAFFSRLVDMRDTAGIYPLNPAYLTPGQPPAPEAQKAVGGQVE